MCVNIKKRCEFCKVGTVSRIWKVFNGSTKSEDEIEICVRCYITLSKNKEIHGTSSSNAIVH